VIARFPKLSEDTIDRYLKKAAEVGDLVAGKEGRATTYQKRQQPPEKPDDPHDPHAYRAAEHADNPQDTENVIDRELFDELPESGADDVAERSGGDLRFYPDSYDDREVGT
jgi:hypothetical protein